MKNTEIRGSNGSLRLAVYALAVTVMSTSALAQGSVDVRLEERTHLKATAALAANPNLKQNPCAVMVKFSPNATQRARARAKSRASATTIRQYRIVPGLELVHTSRSPEAAVAILKKMPGVEYAELDSVMHADQGGPPQRFPTGQTFYPYSWGMHNDGQFFNGHQATAGADVNGPEAWYLTIGDPNFVVAIIDSGVQYTHHNLDDNIWANPGEIAGNGIDDDGNGYVDDTCGWDFYDGDNDPMDENGHGTHTAGTVGATGQGVIGMMWQCKLMPLRYLGPNGGGWTSDAILALQYATEKGVKVSNNSYGGTRFDQSFYDAINASKAVEHVFVASAGNDGINNDTDRWKKYPASYDLDNIISVAATDMNDAMASWSNYGSTSVDLGAPGVYILSTYLLDWGGPGYTQRYLDGTSMAAPHVAGAAGLVYVQNPTWTYQEVRTRIISSARPVASLAGKTASGGVLDAAAALGVFVPPPPAAPAVPGAPVLTKLGGGVVRVVWADNSSNEDGFRVRREKKVGSSWTGTVTVADVGANVTTVNDTPGIGTFRYSVQSYNGVGGSAWSAWTQVKT